MVSVSQNSFEVQSRFVCLIQQVFQLVDILIKPVKTNLKVLLVQAKMVGNVNLEPCFSFLGQILRFHINHGFVIAIALIVDMVTMSIGTTTFIVVMGKVEGVAVVDQGTSHFPSILEESGLLSVLRHSLFVLLQELHIEV